MVNLTKDEVGQIIDWLKEFKNDIRFRSYTRRTELNRFELVIRKLKVIKAEVNGGKKETSIKS